MKAKNVNFAIQLEIDFLLPYDLSPMLDDLYYEMELTGTISVPCSIVHFKKRK